MLGTDHALLTATDHPRNDASRGAKALLQRPSILAAALASLALGLVLAAVLGGNGASVAPWPHSHRFSQQGLLSLPLSAQGAVSAKLGAHNPAYQVSAMDGALVATNPAEHLRLGFSRSGVTVRSGAAHFALGLRGVGYGTSLQAVEAVNPIARGNRVRYMHSGLTEWYRNGPLGVEQGFTIPRAPA